MNEEQNDIEKAKTILMKNPQDRLNSEIFFLSRKIGYFFMNYKEILSDDLYLSIFKNLRLEIFKKYEVVFHYGDLGKKIYYILKGEAYVLVPKIFDVNDHSSLSLNNFHKNLPVNEAEILHSFPSFLIRTVLKEGYNFGEVALIIKGCRNSTIVCKEDCELLVLNSETYDKIKKKNLNNIYSEKIEFLTDIPMFNQWRRTNISLVMFYLRDITVNKEQFIYKENDEISGIYIIYDGEIEIYKSFSKPKIEERARVFHKRLISVGKLAKGQTFGEEEIFSSNKRNYYAKCVSLSCKLLLFTKKDLFDNIKSHVYLENMRKDAEIKVIYRENYYKKKMEFINQYRTERVKPHKTMVTPDDIDDTMSQQFSSRSNIMSNLLSAAEKHQMPIKKPTNPKNLGFSTFLKSSVIAHLVSSIPKYKNKVLSFKEKKTLEKNYESDLSNKIRAIVEKRIEGNLTDRPITTPLKRIKRTRSSEWNAKNRQKSEHFNMDNEVKLNILSFVPKKQSRVFRSFYFREDSKVTMNNEKNEKDFVYNFYIKKKI